MVISKLIGDLKVIIKLKERGKVRMSEKGYLGKWAHFGVFYSVFVRKNKKSNCLFFAAYGPGGKCLTSTYKGRKKIGKVSILDARKSLWGTHKGKHVSVEPVWSLRVDGVTYKLRKNPGEKYFVSRISKGKKEHMKVGELWLDKFHCYKPDSKLDSVIKAQVGLINMVFRD